MIIWNGLGYLAAVLTFAACLIAQLFFDRQFGAGYYFSHLWTVGLGLLVGGAASAAAGYALKSRSDRELIDAKTGERVVVNRSQHSFFFLPLHWAGLAIAAIGIGLIAADAFR